MTLRDKTRNQVSPQNQKFPREKGMEMGPATLQLQARDEK
jgi:hypothetical protein